MAKKFHQKIQSNNSKVNKGEVMQKLKRTFTNNACLEQLRRENREIFSEDESKQSQKGSSNATCMNGCGNG